MSQDTLTADSPKRSNAGGSFLQRILTPSRITLISRWVVRHIETLRLGKRVFIFRWQLVDEVLRRDSDFLISPVNATRINDVSGPFILGMDRSIERNRQRQAIYQAMTSINKEKLTNEIRAHCEEILRLAQQRSSQNPINIVNDYARPIATDTAIRVFGVPGVPREALMNTLRPIFHETFLNLQNEKTIKLEGQRQGQILSKWIAEELKQRREAGQHRDDVLGVLIVLQPDLGYDDDELISMIAGLMVGAVDTTATTVANIMMVLCEKPSWYRRARIVATDYSESNNAELWGWCQEALRFHPHNPIVMRAAAHASRLGRRKIRKGDSVIAVTVAAMQDSAAFPHPATIIPTRNPCRYLHFGGGVHHCTGRMLNRIQVPELLRGLLVYGSNSLSKPVFDGPFPDQLLMGLKSTAQAGED